MTDLPAMDPCPYAKRGAHDLMCVTPEDSTGDLTYTCSACGMTRRIPVSGQLVGESLDAMTADAIVARLGFSV